MRDFFLGKKSLECVVLNLLVGTTIPLYLHGSDQSWGKLISSQYGNGFSISTLKNIIPNPQGAFRLFRPCNCERVT